MKNIYEEEKKFDSRTWFILENGPQLGVFWRRKVNKYSLLREKVL